VNQSMVFFFRLHDRKEVKKKRKITISY